MSISDAEAHLPPKAIAALGSILTRAECERILAKAYKSEKNLRLKSITLEPAVYTNGFLGEYYNLLLHYNVAESDENQNSIDGRKLHELRAFVKRVPQASVEPEKEAIFRKEASLYEKLLGRMRRYSIVPWSPRHFYARDDLIVLEHLDQLSYALCPENNENLSDHYLRQVIRGLAAQHASSVTFEIKEDICIGDANPQLQHEITVSAQVPWYSRGLQAIIAVIQLRLASQSRATREIIDSRLPAAIESVYEMTNRSVKYRNVLCHRDIWRGNIFYKNTVALVLNTIDRSALFVDYQTARYCPPAIDLIYALFMNLDKHTRKNKEKEYLNFYYKCFERDLNANGLKVEEHITQSELLASYEEFQLFGLFYRSIAFTIIKVPREYITNEYVHVQRTSAILKLMGELPEFRKCLEESVQEIIAYLVETNV